MSALARKEEWNTLSALRKEKIKGFACQLNDSTQNRKPPLHVCGSILPKTSTRRMNTWTAESKGTARGRGGAARALETLGAEALAGGRCSVPSDGTSHRISR